jgi:hypothetical protein
MAMLPGAFDANNVEPQEDFTPVPAGEYPVIINDSEMKGTSTGGQMLVLTLQIVDGQYKGRLVWDRLNLVNKNPKAVEIAQRPLSAICRAVGIMAVQDSAQLHNKPMIARVTYVEAQGQYGAKNEVKAYKAMSGTENVTALQTKPATKQHQAAEQPAQQQTQPAGDKPPWA